MTAVRAEAETEVWVLWRRSRSPGNGESATVPTPGSWKKQSIGHKSSKSDGEHARLDTCLAPGLGQVSRGLCAKQRHSRDCLQSTITAIFNLKNPHLSVKNGNKHPAALAQTEGFQGLLQASLSQRVLAPEVPVNVASAEARSLQRGSPKMRPDLLGGALSQQDAVVVRRERTQKQPQGPGDAATATESRGPLTGRGPLTEARAQPLHTVTSASHPTCEPCVCGVSSAGPVVWVTPPGTRTQH